MGRLDLLARARNVRRGAVLALALEIVGVLWPGNAVLGAAIQAIVYLTKGVPK